MTIAATARHAKHFAPLAKIAIKHATIGREMMARNAMRVPRMKPESDKRRSRTPEPIAMRKRTRGKTAPRRIKVTMRPRNAQPEQASKAKEQERAANEKRDRDRAEAQRGHGRAPEKRDDAKKRDDKPREDKPRRGG